MNYFSRYSNFDIAVMFIEKDADDIAMNDEGKTALHETCGNSSFECVNLLYDNGADLNIKVFFYSWRHFEAILSRNSLILPDRVFSELKSVMPTIKLVTFIHSG
jgi:ankyrin repeat protein